MVRKSVAKDLAPLPKKDVARLVSAMRRLADEPRPPQARKLSGEDKYRLRCGVYRIIYEIRNDELIVIVVRARHRRDAYR